MMLSVSLEASFICVIMQLDEKAWRLEWKHRHHYETNITAS
ncbi:MAG: hypothetical protein PWP51_2403 [Clostridiales bacterium]|jgi:hypothetical protein|nr:hypothetical protein [Clostridiales bacterium]MDN5299850.1 hypothetical protein [Clostridiales bacterium]